MYKALAALIYTAFALVAIAAQAGSGTDIAALKVLRSGDMKKLNFTEAPQAIPASGFETFEGKRGDLAQYRGKVVLLNFWATWCAPCRKEMPMLSALQSELGGDGFDVVTIAVGRNPPPAMTQFFNEIGVDNLPMYRDPKQQLARKMAVLGLPITVILDPEGREVARLRGDADWASDSAKAILTTLIASES